MKVRLSSRLCLSQQLFILYFYASNCYCAYRYFLRIFFLILSNIKFKIEIHYLGSFSYSWLLTFMPLFVLCPLAVAACIWAYNHERSLEVLIINLSK